MKLLLILCALLIICMSVQAHRDRNTIEELRKSGAACEHTKKVYGKMLGIR